jgi:hypothetical protein
MDRYRGGWKADPDGRPLGSEAWRLLIVVLLSYVAAQALDREEGRGMALKLINAAFAGVDLAGEALNATTRQTLQESAGGMLDLVLGEREA